MNKGVYTFLLLIVAIIFAGYSCKSDNSAEDSEPDPAVIADLKKILKDGKLTVLMENSTTSYFIYRGKKMGFEYEILREFADELGVVLEVKVVDNLDDLIPMLNKGEGDLIACNYTYTKSRKADIEFSEPYIRTPQVLIQRYPEGWEKMKEKELTKHLILSPEQLNQKKVHVWKNSSYYNRLINLQEETGDTIFLEEVDGQIGTEELIEMTSEGMIDYTVAEQNIAMANQKFYPNIHISTVLSVQQKICFGLRKNNPILKARLDKFINIFTKKVSYRYLKKKYFEMSAISNSSKFKPGNIKRGELSPYDAIFKQVAQKYGFDWRILASISYHESRFNPNARGFGGAYGMMQFMPSTGPKYGVYPSSPPSVQIEGGMKKIAKDFQSWSHIPDEEQRFKFTLATYNAGKGHVQDAQRLAEKHGLNPEIWDENVEKMMLNLSKQSYYRDPVVKNGAHHGGVTYRYVKDIYGRYLEWKEAVR
mgnify:CR=1 FL=1|jgi:membrane-bound lytic murein transglycosylase F